jgi:hypothetical protein
MMTTNRGHRTRAAIGMLALLLASRFAAPAFAFGEVELRVPFEAQNLHPDLVGVQIQCKVACGPEGSNIPPTPIKVMKTVIWQVPFLTPVNGAIPKLTVSEKFTCQQGQPTRYACWLVVKHKNGNLVKLDHDNVNESEEWLQFSKAHWGFDLDMKGIP